MSAQKAARDAAAHKKAVEEQRKDFERARAAAVYVQASGTSPPKAPEFDSIGTLQSPTGLNPDEVDDFFEKFVAFGGGKNPEESEQRPPPPVINLDEADPHMNEEELHILEDLNLLDTNPQTGQATEGTPEEDEPLARTKRPAEPEINVVNTLKPNPDLRYLYSYFKVDDKTADMHMQKLNLPQNRERRKEAIKMGSELIRLQNEIKQLRNQIFATKSEMKRAHDALLVAPGTNEEIKEFLQTNPLETIEQKNQARKTLAETFITKCNELRAQIFL